MRPGDLYLAPFQYADLAQAKRRPVSVVSTEHFHDGPDVIVAMVTSSRARLRSPALGDVPLRDWLAAGLLAESTLRAGRLQTMEMRLLTRQLGSLSEPDLAAVRAALRDVLELA